MEKLADIIRNIDNYKWSYALYLPEDEVWVEETLCMVLDPNDVEDDEDEMPRIAQENVLMYGLGVQMIQSIVCNAFEQKSNCTDAELLEAFLYYYDNDAYIEIKE